MARSGTIKRRLSRSRGFTLVEMLVVLVIVLLLSVAAAAVIPGAFREQKVSDAARTLQAYLEQAHDAAVRAGTPRGIRLLPDFEFPGPLAGKPLAYSRMIMIEPAPDYSEGFAFQGLGVDAFSGTPIPFQTTWPDPYTTPAAFPTSPTNLPLIGPPQDPRLQVYQRTYQYYAVSGVTIPLAPTSWYWNIRQGDKIQFGGSGRQYTVAGPNLAGRSANPERFVNYLNTLPPWTATGDPTFASTNLPAPYSLGAEVLYLVNGVDDNGNGFIDESFDGIDNDGDGVIDPGFDGVDNNQDGVIDDPYELLWSTAGYTGGEYEQEQWIGPAPPLVGTPTYTNYVIKRRPVPSQSSNQELSLPAGTVIDATTLFENTIGLPVQAERSRLPIDPFTGYIDILVNPSGEVVQANASATNAPQYAFYHFWITEREDVHPPLWGVRPVAGSLVPVPYPNPQFPNAINLLPMPQAAGGTVNIPAGYVGSPYLRGSRRLVTLFPKTGNIVSNSLENFSLADLNMPFYEAQLGTRETK